MSYRIVKFGGSNLQNAADFSRCAEIIRNYETPCIIVVSAFFQVTDHLKEAALQASDSGDFPAIFIEEFSATCFEQIRVNIDDQSQVEQANKEIQELLDKLALLFKGVHAIGELPPTINDSILSFGERISAVIFTAVLRSKNHNVSLGLPENFGLITDGEFGGASILLRESSKKIKGYFKENQFYVVPGFYGVSQEGKTTLLGRGGTDYSAAALANLLDAESLDVWKDVSGFKTGDPKVVKDSQTIEFLSYSEAAELSYFGAKILHPRTVEPLQPKNIPVRVFDITAPSTTPGTIIGQYGGEDTPGPKSITYSRNFSVLKLKGAGVGNKPGVLAQVAGIMDNAGVNISSVFTSQTAICFLLNANDLKRASRAIKSGAPVLISEVETISDIALVALVGEGITKKRGIAAKAFQAVAAENINIEIIAAGASTAAVYFVVLEKDCDRAVKATHTYFFPECPGAGSHQHSDLTSFVL
jgi:bifunctional aspartokinase / homoserine dehydrogenase 1